MVGYQCPIAGVYTNVAPPPPPPPPFTDLLWGRGREGWVQSQKAIPSRREACQLVPWTSNTMYINTNLLNIRANCGSAEQPLLDPIEKALNQLKPHPSNRIVWRCYVAGWVPGAKTVWLVSDIFVLPSMDLTSASARTQGQEENSLEGQCFNEASLRGSNGALPIGTTTEGGSRRGYPSDP